MTNNSSYEIPEDYHSEIVRENMKMQMSSARKWFDRPAYAGTIAEVKNVHHIDSEEITDYNVKS